MTAQEIPLPRSESVVTIQSPGGREFLWLAAASPVLRWQVGDAVDFRNRRWIVLDRTQEPNSLSFTIAAE